MNKINAEHLEALNSDYRNMKLVINRHPNQSIPRRQNATGISIKYPNKILLVPSYINMKHIPTLCRLSERIQIFDIRKGSLIQIRRIKREIIKKIGIIKKSFFYDN